MQQYGKLFLKAELKLKGLLRIGLGYAVLNLELISC